MTSAVGFIGLGQIGGPMATHLLDRPEALVVHDARADAMEPFVEKGAIAVDTPRAVAARASVVSVMVLDDAQVVEVVSGPDGLLAGATPGLLIALHSTIRPETAEAMAALAAERDVALVDAPVSGGFIGAHQGTLAVMIGGTAEAFERCREPFAPWSSLLVHAGPVGSGTRMKLARNMLHFISFSAAGEAARLAEAAGIDVRALAQVVRHSDGVTGGASAIIFRDTAQPVRPGDQWYDLLDHTRVLGEKDLEMARALARALGIATPLADLASARLGVELGVREGER